MVTFLLLLLVKNVFGSFVPDDIDFEICEPTCISKYADGIGIVINKRLFKLCYRQTSPHRFMKRLLEI